MEVTRMRSPEEELTSPNWPEFGDNFYDPDSSCKWYITVRAVEEFRTKNGRYPGHTEG
jgi:hypothetical protein